jgi:hypothetical protein
MLAAAFSALLASLIAHPSSTSSNLTVPLPAVSYNEIAYPSNPILHRRNLQLHRRDNPWSVYLCEAQNWTQPCHYVRGTQGECFTMFEQYQGRIQSFGPDRNQMCTLYDRLNCAAEAEEGEWRSWDAAWPGNRTMRGAVVEDFWSWRCIAEGTRSVP